MSPAGLPPLPVWIDGTLLDADQALMPLADRGLTLGDGVFETMLWQPDAGPRGVVLFEAHMARLSHAARSLGLAAAIDVAAIAAGIAAVCRDGAGPLAVRLTLTAGGGPRGLARPDPLHPVVALSAAPFERPGPLEVLVRTGIGRTPGAPSARFKTLSYIDSVMALREARAAGGGDGLMAGAGGRPVCASAASLIVAVDGTCLTPPAADGALPGIVRGVLVAAGLVREAPVDWAVLERADGIALSNALAGVREVVAFEGRRLPAPAGWSAPLTRHLDSARRHSLQRWPVGPPASDRAATRPGDPGGSGVRAGS